MLETRSLDGWPRHDLHHLSMTQGLPWVTDLSLVGWGRAMAAIPAITTDTSTRITLLPQQCSIQAVLLHQLHIFPPLTLCPWCACTNMAPLPIYWCKFHDVEGEATDAGQPRGTTPEVCWLFACSSKTLLCQTTYSTQWNGAHKSFCL